MKGALHMWDDMYVDCRHSTTGGVSYTVGGATAPPAPRFAPPTLCFATPTFERFGGFRALKRWFPTLGMQNCYICRHFGIQFPVFIP